MSDAPVLPEEIVADVLSRLPVKSLCRFKCVSHSWHSLISDPHFAQTHLTRNNNNNNMPERLILISHSHALYSVDYSTDVPAATKLDFFPSLQAQFYDVWAKILGSCNGLLLALNEENYDKYLLNPSTRESKKLPKSSFALDSLEGCNQYGLGFDSLTDDYKVVMLSYYVRITSDEESEGTTTDTNNNVSVYSLKANSWRSIQGGSSYVNLPFSVEVYGNGVFHWLDFRFSDYFSTIVTFDLANESFRELPLPTPVEYPQVLLCRLAVLGGCLCFLALRDTQTDFHYQTDVWMMKEYGVRESWTKIATYMPNKFPNFLCSLEDGEFLLAMDEEKLVVYNPKEGTKRDMVVCGIPTWFVCWGTYVESLISPNGIVRRFEAPVRKNGEDSSE